MLMTHEEIKNAMLDGKILYRNKKDGTKVEYKAQAGKFLRRETLPGVVPGVWHNADICTMSRYEWNIIENQEETKMKQEEPTTDVIRQVPLGDGTTTVITEKVPVSQAPIIVDPFECVKVREDVMAILSDVSELENTPAPEEEEEEEEKEEVEEPQTMSALLAIKAMEEGQEVVWVPLEEDHGLQVKFFHDWDGKFKEVRANCSHISENINMNQFLSHTYLCVEGNIHPFFTALSMVTSYGPRCFIRNIITGKVIRGPNYSDDPDETSDDYPIEPLEVGTILPIELSTFWAIDFEEVDDE